MARVYDPVAESNEYKVHDIVTMGKHPNDAEAKQMLTKIAKQVQPIMRKRSWRVPRLSEFFPANANLLGLNIGGGGGNTREIKVRLRPTRDPLSFLPYNDLIGTMLHELVHNVRGPHDSVFYKLLDELWTECEDLMDRGISGTGSGFDGPSSGRLGSHAFIPQHNPDPRLMREAALKAAEERCKKQRLMASGPQRLGGDPSAMAALDPGRAAARAAERRSKDNLWCPCETIGEALDAVRSGKGGGGRGGAKVGVLGARRVKAEQQEESSERRDSREAAKGGANHGLGAKQGVPQPGPSSSAVLGVESITQSVPRPRINAEGTSSSKAGGQGGSLLGAKVNGMTVVAGPPSSSSRSGSTAGGNRVSAKPLGNEVEIICIDDDEAEEILARAIEDDETAAGAVGSSSGHVVLGGASSGLGMSGDGGRGLGKARSGSIASGGTVPGGLVTGVGIKREGQGGLEGPLSPGQMLAARAGLTRMLPNGVPTKSDGKPPSMCDSGRLDSGTTTASAARAVPAPNARPSACSGAAPTVTVDLTGSDGEDEGCRTNKRGGGGGDASRPLPTFWECPVCTFSNKALVRVCDLCATARP